MFSQNVVGHRLLAAVKCIRAVIFLCIAFFSTHGVAQVITLTASPATINPGGTSTLSWNVTGATSCTYNGGAMPLSGSSTAAPTATTTYMLICYNGAASATKSATVTVNPPVVNFSVTPNPVPYGQNATWNWSSSYATSCTYQGGSFATSGTLIGGPYTVAGTTSHTLTCTGASGTTSKTVSFVVSPPVAPTVTFNVSSNPVTLGQNATWTWSSTNATSCTYAGQPYATSGSLLGGPYNVAGTTSHTLTCSGAGGSASKTISFVVAPGNDSTPNAFSFSPKSNAQPGALEVSSPATISGFNVQLTASVSGSGSPAPKISIQGGPWVTSGAINPNNTIAVQMQASPNYQTSRTATVTVGSSTSATWTVTTVAPVQLSAGFDSQYQVRSGDFNSDGRIDMYVSLNPQITNLAGVRDFILSQQSSLAFSLLNNLSIAQRTAGQQAPLISSQVELFATDLNGDDINDLFLRNLNTAIPGVNDVLVFASPVAGNAPTGLVMADSEFKKFFTDVRSWISNPLHFHETAIDNGDVALIPNGPPILADWRLDYLWFVGYGTGLDGLSPYVSDDNDIYDPLASIFGCNNPALYQGFNSYCYFSGGVWWVRRTAISFSYDFDFGDFNPDAIALIQPHTANIVDVGILRTVLSSGVIRGSAEAILIADILAGIFNGNATVLGGVLASSTATWGDTLPAPDVLPSSERNVWISWKLSRLFNIIGLLLSSGNMFDNWDLYHYAGQAKKTGVDNANGILYAPPDTGILYFTNQIFPTAWFAKECLALPGPPPIGYWTVRQEDDVIALGPTPVAPRNWDVPPNPDNLGYGLLKGTGNEYISFDPFVRVNTRVFVRLPQGIRLSHALTQCPILGGIGQFFQ